MPKPNSKPTFSWTKQRVVVTGGAGFLGSYVVEQLQERKCRTIIVPRSRDYDLRESSSIKKLLQASAPTMIIHLAAQCGGIGANQKKGARFFYDNAIMGIQLMEFAKRHGVQKYVQVGTVCSYPGNTPVPFKEKDLWNGYPETTNAPYGLAKKILLVQAQAYRRDDPDFDVIYLLPANLYGPRDHFDLENSHVIPALIRKIHEARESGHRFLDVWGTGKASREFLYAADAAQGILQAAERYHHEGPVNLGTGSTITIKALVTLLCQLMQYEGRILWNTKRPDGQIKRQLDVSRARRYFGFRAQTSLRQGLQNTIDWYLRHAHDPA